MRGRKGRKDMLWGGREMRFRRIKGGKHKRKAEWEKVPLLNLPPACHFELRRE